MFQKQILFFLLCLGCLSAKAQEVDNLAVVKPAVPEVWQNFSLSDVRLSPGSPFYHAMQKDEEYLKGMDVNRMLNGWLKRAGLPERKGQYPGSDQPVDTRPGYMSHYLSAISLMYGQTGDLEFKKRVDTIVSTLAEVRREMVKQGKNDQFLYSQRTLRNMDQLEEGSITLAGPDEVDYPWGGMGNFWYGVHKALAGLRDAYIYTGNKQAFGLWKNESDFIVKFALNANPDLFDDMLDIEHGGMNEVFADLYALTGNKDYMTVSKMFNHQKVILNTAVGRDVLYGRHVNMQVPTFVGTARQYQLTGDSVTRDATLNFLDLKYNTQNNVIGGSGRYERYLPANNMKEALGFTSDETCATYNMVKVANAAFEFTGDFKHLDYLERALYNHILASQDPESGGFTYYVSLMPGGFKSFSKGYDLEGVWCCVGTGMENHAKYGHSIFFKNNDGLLVDLFIPSTLKWKEEGLEVELKTSFPESDKVDLVVTKSDGYRKNISFRNPSWAHGKIEAKINGKPVKISAKAGEPITFDRKWRTGDRIEMTFPQSFYFESANDDPHLKALLHGPIVMASELGKDKMPESDLVSSAMHYNNWVTPQQDIPMLVADLDDPSSWLKQKGKNPLHFVAEKAGLRYGKRENISYIPFYEMRHQRYSVYLKTFSPQELEQRHEVVSDEVNPSDEANEKAHNLQGEKMDTIRFKDNRHFWENNRYGREAKKEGWFSYDLDVNNADQQYLSVTYWGSASQNRGLDIYIDGTKIESIQLDDKHPITYYNETYKIQQQLTQNKNKVTVMFKAKPDTEGGAIYGLKISSNPEEFEGYGFY